ncbi:MAG: hypothetical protein LBQ59_05755 [Candidatus Peribacteria bacterium]|nr:hypothetical protein [Candidatus Peribacteria bacterium]
MLIGAIKESCQKLNIIIGNVRISAENVKLNAVLISKIFGTKLSFFSKNG